ncbi:MAG: DNA gyrase inhibitor YacG [Planctomycetia bacterium]|nr:DNA gyrase inhibitor YacG [Planctomycetia bacterium]
MPCSERCRLIDLGRWLGESYQVPLPRHAAEDDEDEQAGTGGPAHPADDE